MALTEKQLIELKEKVDLAKTTVAQLTGQQSALMAQLKETTGCSTIEEAEEKKVELEGKIAKLDEDVRKGTEELQRKYNLQ